MKKIFTFLLSLIFIGSISAQSRLDYDNDSRWFWGLNVGGTWSTADVKYNTNVGWGIVLGKSFNYQEGRIASFDIRGRFLTGNWEGLNSGLTRVDSLSPYSGLGTDTVKLNHLTRSNVFRFRIGFTCKSFACKIWLGCLCVWWCWFNILQIKR